MNHVNTHQAESHAMTLMREARAQLLITHPFFGVLALKIKMEENQAIHTARVNHTRMEFNPGYIQKLSNGQRKTLIAHEVMHLGLLHHTRMNSRDHDLWNQATDYIINAHLVAEKFEPIEGWLLDARFDAKLSAENIYRILEQQKRAEHQQQEPEDSEESESGDDDNESQSAPGDDTAQPDNQPGTGASDNTAPDDNAPQSDSSPAPGTTPPDTQREPTQCPTGEFESAGPEDSNDNESSAREWQENVQEAIRAASSAGKMPGNIKREMNVAASPKADWKTLTRRWFQDQVTQRFTWQKRNKRFVDTFLPGTIKEGLGSIVIGVDTSGSITQDDLNVFAAGIDDILNETNPARVYVVYCDYNVNHVDVFEYGERVKLIAYGGGGTRFEPVFEYVRDEIETQEKIAGLIYLTDLMGSFPRDEPEYPVLWGSYHAQGARAPIGETVEID